MKKKLLLIAICVFSLFLVTGCDSSKTAITTKDFIAKAEEKGLITADVLDQFAEYDFVKEATVAASSNGWQVEFYVLSDEENAKSMFETNAATFNAASDKKKNSTEVEMGNYKKIAFDTDENYMVLTRVDNTMIYVRVPISTKEETKEFIDTLGY